ncbi:response regulator transcription factor [Noviherbaspirillum denitrificans]|uniref:Two-component system response regulator n=1 Tax=Noviherbaspirillum denitrificans TaxID=1968433 RepID=A0A254THA6_9BURK|nr:sigma-70 family RNA polymerase sigma factor [Noviherbaspirillum denitrificans]OWW21557.1 two-component system response regulator [Noviherbaspirillum denitrificans]
MSNELTVFIVDDDPGVRDSLGLLLGLRGYRIALFASAADFLQAWRSHWSGCILIDIRMPGMDGLALQQRLQEIECRLPVIIITGHGCVPLARQAFKANASDFLEKPLDEDKLVHAIEDALNQARSAEVEAEQRSQHAQLLAALTPREQEVMQLVISGRHNREIAQLLGISPRTVEVHKGRLMTKLGVNNVADLVRIGLAVPAT